MAIAFVPDEKVTQTPANDNRVPEQNVTRLTRLFPLFDYQVPMVEAAVDDVLRGERDVLFAATPGSGKSVMMFEIACRLIEMGAAKKILVLAWFRTDLKRQLRADMDAYAPGLSDYVRIEIPQQGHNISG